MWVCIYLLSKPRWHKQQVDLCCAELVSGADSDRVHQFLHRGQGWHSTEIVWCSGRCRLRAVCTTLCHREYCILTKLSVSSYTSFYLQGAHLTYSLAHQNKTEPIYNLSVEKHFLHSIFVRTTQSIGCLTMSSYLTWWPCIFLHIYDILKYFEDIGVRKKNKGGETLNYLWISKGLCLYTQVGKGNN